MISTIYYIFRQITLHYAEMPIHQNAISPSYTEKHAFNLKIVHALVDVDDRVEKYSNIHTGNR